MFYARSWKSGFYTGLITGIAIYALAKTPRGRSILDKLHVVTDILKDQVRMVSRQATDVLDGTVAVAENVSRQEEEATVQPLQPAGAYAEAGSYKAGNI